MSCCDHCMRNLLNEPQPPWQITRHNDDGTVDIRRESPGLVASAKAKRSSEGRYAMIPGTTYYDMVD